MAALAMSPQVFAILSALIEERTGIHYSLTDLDLLRDKIEARVLDAGFESFLDYYYFLKYDVEGAAEFDRLVEVLVVGETYFFREYDQLRLLAEQLVPERIAQGVRPVRIWSAACATGEEPLTLAMMLRHKGLGQDVDLVASDISARSLERARSGRFGRRAARSIPDPALFERYVRREGEDSFWVDPALIGAVAWRQVNLVDAEAVKALGSFDFVLCRNVLIYFREDTARTVVAQLTSALRPGGVLLVSVSESLMRFGTPLEVEERERIFLYRKVR